MSGRVRAGGRTYKLKRITKRASAHRRVKLRLRLTRRSSRALRRSRRSKLRVALRARDLTGNRSRLVHARIRVLR
jgi:hypothetical protein